MATFENESSCHVLCLVKQAGAYGLNLQHCNYLVQFDPHWNAARDEQAVQRIHRIGQHHEVHIFKLWMAGSIDIAIRTMQNSKLKAIASWTRKTAGDEARNLDICCLHLREQDRVHDDTIALAPHPFVAPSLLAVRPPVVQWPAPMPLPFTNPYLEQKDQNAWLGCAVDTDECLYTMLQEARNMPNLSGWTKPAFGFEVPVEFDVPSFRPGTSKACPHLVVTMEAHHSNYTWDLVVLPGTVTYDPSYQVNVHYDQHKRVYASCYCWSGCTIDGQPVSRCTAIRLLPGQTLTFINAISRVSLTYHFSDGVVPPQLPLYAHQQRYTEPVYVQSLSLVKGTLVLYMGQLGVASSSRAVILEDGDGIVRSTERMDVHLAPPIGFIGEPICVACTPCIITSPGEATDKQGKKHLFLIHDRYRVGSMLSFEEYRRRGGIVQQPVPIFVGEVQEPVPKKIKA